MSEPTKVKESAGEHTKGPWHWEVHDFSMASICGPQGEEDHVLSVSPCSNCQKGAAEWKFGRCTTPSEANARRIVACVNACDGIDNEWLEANSGMLQGHDHALERERDQLRERVAELEEMAQMFLDAFEGPACCEARSAMGDDAMPRLLRVGVAARALLAKERP